MKSFRIFAPISDLFKKEELKNTSEKIINNGESNDYAEKNELYIDNSVTATSASNVFKRFLLGLGDEFNKDFKPNKYQKYDEFLDQIGEDYKDHRGFAILVKYNPLGEKKEYHVVNFTDVRKQKVDSNNDTSLFLLCKDWSSKEKTTDAEKYPYYVYNPDPDVVTEQIEASGGFNKYKGQIFYWHGSKAKYHYPISFIHPVMNDADSEFRIQLHRNKRIRGGLLNKKIIITPPALSPHLDYPDSQLSEEDRQLKRDKIQEKNTIDETLKTFVSAENNEGILRLEMQYDGDNLDSVFKVIDIKAESEDGFYEKNEEKIKANIRACYFNVPPILIDSDNSFFGNSGEAMVQAKLFYEENVKFERLKIERALSVVLPIEVKLTPLIKIEDALTSSNIDLIKS